MNEQVRAAVLGWQQTVNAAWEQQQAALLPSAPPEQPPAIVRGLTPREITLARRVFGDRLDTSQVQLTEGGLLSTETKASALPGLITFPAGTLSNPPPGIDFDRWLIHELAHIWQYQQGWTVLDTLDDTLDSDYEYGEEQGLRDAVAAGKPFDEFDLEEQAEILADYYVRLRARGDTSAFDPYVRDVRDGTTSQPPDA